MTKMRMLIIGLMLLSVAYMGCQTETGEAENIQIPVEVQKVGLGEVRQVLHYTGDIAAEFEVKVFSKIPDRIEKFFVDEGDFVAKGDPIAQIVATTIEQAVRQAEAGLSAAQAQEVNLKGEYDRAIRLFKEDAMSQQQYDAVKTQYEAVAAQVRQAEAMLTSAKSQLKDATVSAPISGIIGKRYYEAGDMAAPQLPVVSIVQMDKVKIKFDATEKDLGKLKVGQKAEITVRSYPDKKFEGKLSKISPILDPLTRMAAVEVMIPNPNKLLKPGMYVDAQITTKVMDQVLVVPRFAVIESTSMVTENNEDRVVKNYYVYTVSDSNTAEQRKLEPSYVNHVNIAVSSGIEVGDRLVVAGQNNLRDGSPVLVADKEETM